MTMSAFVTQSFGAQANPDGVTVDWAWEVMYLSPILGRTDFSDVVVNVAPTDANNTIRSKLSAAVIAEARRTAALPDTGMTAAQIAEYNGLVGSNITLPSWQKG
jgi:hypothetical protein